MTRKDYQLIAAAVNRGLRVATAASPQSPFVASTVSLIVDELAEALRTANPRFSRDLFNAACLEGN